MGALLGGGGGGGGGQQGPSINPGPFVSNMEQDLGVMGQGWTPGQLAGGTGTPQPTGAPTPDAQLDFASLAAGAMNQGQLTANQLALINANNPNAAGNAFSSGFQSTQGGNSPNQLGNPASDTSNPLS